jgi:hypothetical protein
VVAHSLVTYSAGAVKSRLAAQRLSKTGRRTAGELLSRTDPGHAAGGSQPMSMPKKMGQLQAAPIVSVDRAAEFRQIICA